MSTRHSTPWIRLFVKATNTIHPGLSRQALKGKASLMLSLLKSRHFLDAFFDQPEHEALYRNLLVRPDLLGFVVWPYIHAGWSMTERFDALAQHEQAVRSDMAPLAFRPSGSLVISDMSDVSPGLKLVVDRAPWCLREGSLVFNQFLNDERLMSLAFSFGWLGGERVVYVGSVQGSNVDSALTKYREIAKDLQGMRSRDFLIKAFQFLTHHLGVERVLCISDEERHHRHPYFGPAKAEKFHLNYNEIWQEHSGTRTDGGFYQLSSLPVVRQMEDIAAKNRPLYRRRYALMARLSEDIASRFGAPNRQTHPEPQQP